MDFSDAELGPKMQACMPRERLFVWHYLLNGGKDATAAARLAGYPDPGPQSSSIRVRGHWLTHKKRVLDAINEVSRVAFDGLLLPAVSAAERMIDNEKHPDHAKMVLSVLSRLGLGERSAVDHNFSGEVSVNHTDQALEHLRMLRSLEVPRGKLEEIFGFSGLTRYERMLAEADRAAPKLIEGEVARE